jgi:hypothetical protein
MNDTAEPRKGNLVIGAMLVLVGLGVALERSGVIEWSSQWTLWPFILGGIGLALFVQSPPGEPKRGLIFLTGAAWLFAVEGGWVSVEDSWPILVIAVGLLIALNGGRRRRWHVPDQPDQPGDPRMRRMYRHRRTLTPLAVLGIWIAVFVGLQVSGMRSFDRAGMIGRSGVIGLNETGSNDRVRIVSVMGRSEHISRATAFHGAEITNVMGRSELDLRDATLAPGTRSTVHIFSLMGGVILRVPPTWTIDSSAITAMGGVRDERGPAPSDAPQANAGPSPRLALDGLVTMGRLTIR